MMGLHPRFWEFEVYLLGLPEKDYGKSLEKFRQEIIRRVRGSQCPISLFPPFRGPQTIAHREDGEAGKGAVPGLSRDTCRS